MANRETNRRELTLGETAEWLGLLPAAVQSLAFVGFLSASSDDAEGQPRFDLADVKAFAARNADDGAGFLSFDEEEPADPQDLLEALDGESESMANRAFELFATVFPASKQWTLREQRDFVTQAKARFEAILAVTGSGAEVDAALVGDLQEVGAEAAWSGSSLPQLLVVLRISRDLVVQTAVRLAEERGGH